VEDVKCGPRTPLLSTVGSFWEKAYINL